MGSRNLNKWFSDEVNNIDHIAAIFVGITQGDAKELNAQAYDALPSIWYTLSKHIFKSTDVVHRMRLCNMWLDNRKGLRDKYYELARSTPNTPKIVRRRMETSSDLYRCFCEKNITWNKKVDMIMCDNCGSFYHEFCIQRSHTKETSSFVCPRCTGDLAVPPLFLLTPEQSSMVRRKISTLVESSQCVAEDHSDEDKEVHHKHQPKKLDAEFAAELTREVTIKTESTKSDMVVSEIKDVENALGKPTLPKLTEIFEITELSDHDESLDMALDNEIQQGIHHKSKGIASKVKKILQDGLLSMTRRKPKPAQHLCSKSELQTALENVLELVRNEMKPDTDDKLVDLEESKKQPSENKPLPNENTEDFVGDNDDGHLLYSQNNDKGDDNDYENDDYYKTFNDNDYDDKIPLDLEIDDIIKTPIDSDNEGEDISENEHTGEHLKDDDDNHFDNDQILDNQPSCNTDTENDNNDGLNIGSGSNIFEPFTIFIVKDTWKKIMHRGEKKIKLDDGTEVRATFHSINPRNFHDTLYKGFMKVWPACTPTTTKTKLKQPGELINSTAAYLRVYADCSRKPVCTAKYSFTLPTIPENNEDDVEFRVRKTSGTVTHSANEVATRQLRGDNRDAIKEKLKHEYPTAIRTKAFADADPEILKHGNFTEIPKLKVMQNIIQEITKEFRLSDDDFYDLLLTSKNMESEHGKNVKGYIQSLSARPFRVVLFTEDNLRAFRLINTSNSGACLFFDATANIVEHMKPPHETQRPFLYTLLMKGYTKHKPIAISEMVTTNQSSYNISVMLGEFFYSYRYMFKDRRKYYGISQIETDFSKAIIAAVLHVLEKCSTEDYLKKIWDLMKNPTNKQDFLALHVCRWHFYKFFSKNLKIALKGKAHYAEQIRFWTIWSYRLASMKDLWTFHRLVEDVCVILSDKYYSDEVRSRVEKVHNRTSRDGVPFWKDFVPTSSDDSPLWLRIPFGNYADTIFMMIVDKRMTRTKNYNVRNHYKSHKLLKYIMRNILPYAGIFSHAVFELKDIPVVHDTQGHMENHFKILKHGKMHKKKSRTMGDFVRNQVVYTKGECTRFLVELPLYLQSDKPKNKSQNAREGAVVTNIQETQPAPSTSQKKPDSRPHFIFPGKQGLKSTDKTKPTKKTKGATLSDSKGRRGNFTKTRDKFKSMQDFIQKRAGSVDNIFDASKNVENQSTKKINANWKSAENLLEGSGKTTGEAKGRNDWKGSLLNVFGTSKKSKTENLELNKNGDIYQGKLNPSSVPPEHGSTSKIFGSKPFQSQSDDDESDNAIPKSKTIKERTGRRTSPQFAEEKFKAEQRRRGAKSPSTFLTLMTRIPWGGNFMYGGTAYKFSNTCPLDNFLQIFYALYEHKEKGRNFINNITDPVGQVLKKSIEFIREEKFATAKAHWLINTGATTEPLAKYMTRRGLLDLFDCQSEIAWSKIYNCFPIFEISWCETKNCPLNETRNRKVILVDSLIRNHINHTISLFNKPYQAVRNCEFCGLKSRQKILEFLDPSPDIFFYECEGWASIPGAEGQSYTFVPTCLEEEMTLEQNFGGVIYDVFAYTLKDKSRDHFITVFVHNGRKIMYDGLDTTSFNLYQGTLTVCSVVLVKR